MTDILSDFIQQGHHILKDAPFDFYCDPISHEPSHSIAPTYYLKWASERDLLKNKRVRELIAAASDLESKTKAILDSVGEMLTPSLFNPQGASFTQNYYRPGWKFFYLTDVSSIFPGAAKFEEISDTQNNYLLVSERIDERYESWKITNSRLINGK